MHPYLCLICTCVHICQVHQLLGGVGAHGPHAVRRVMEGCAPEFVYVKMGATVLAATSTQNSVIQQHAQVRILPLCRYVHEMCVCVYIECVCICVRVCMCECACMCMCVSGHEPA